MFRQRRTDRAPANDGEGFRLRGTQVSRIEGISDAVFGLALTLIVVTLKAPTTFKELADTLIAFIPSGGAVLILVQVWNRHYLYFRRYALEDGITRTLNTVLLFLVIAYVYPLKFLFSAFFTTVSGVRTGIASLTIPDLPLLFVSYGAGFCLVYLTFGLMYAHALRSAPRIELNELEVLQTRWIMWEHLILAFVGFLSIVFAVALHAGSKGYAGFVYFLIPIFLTIHGMKHGDAVRKLKAEIASRELGGEPIPLPVTV